MKLRVGKGVLNGNQFIEVHNNGSVNPPQLDGVTKRFLEFVKMDSHLNGYDPESPTIRVPQFTFEIIACLPVMSKQRLTQDNPSQWSPVGFGSSAFDLAQSLRLLPFQECSEYNLPMVEIDIDKVGRYHDRYCGYLSRHGLVLLTSLYTPNRVSTVSDSGIGGCILIDTSLGRFKIFEHDHRTCVHFDSGNRTGEESDCPDQAVELAPWERREVIRKAAEGQYLAKNFYIQHEMIAMTPFIWKRPSSAPAIKIAISNVIQEFNHSVFLPRSVVREWQEVEQFAATVLGIVGRIFFEIEEPRRLAQLRDIYAAKIGHDTFVGITTPDERLEEDIILWMTMVFRASATPENLAVISKWTSTFVHEITMKMMVILYRGHEKYRKAEVDLRKLIDTSEKRFFTLFEGYKAQQSANFVEQQIRKLLHKSDNICLVLLQGALAKIAYRNARKRLESSIEAPDGWIEFILKQDSQLLIG